MEIVDTTEPYASVEADDGVQHTIWSCSVEDSDFFEIEFSKLPNTYVADGHHRTAAAYNVGSQRR